MVLDYSKWDALELSDDSDIEVHPNVDKRSFIQAKQNQIHQQREQRRHEIKTLKFEQTVNDGLLSGIEKLLDALRENPNPPRFPEEPMFQVLMNISSDPEKNHPKPPPGVYTHVKEHPQYSQMLSIIIDEVKKEMGDDIPDDIIQFYTKGIQGHKDKVQDLQKKLLERLAELEKEEGSKITSENLHTGFDTSHVAKPSEKEKASSAGKSDSVELLNPGAGNKDVSSSGNDADDDDDPADAKTSDLAKRFAKIRQSDYQAQLQFIGEHPEIVAEKETDGLLIEAFNSQMEGKDDYARQCVHHGLLLQYCRSLGRDGVSLFFKRFVLTFHSDCLTLRKKNN